jgi:LAO/AO transport system kinase
MDIGEGDDWEPPIVETQAHKGVGIEELCEAIERHRAYLTTQKPEQFRKVMLKRTLHQFSETLKDELFKEMVKRIERRGESLETIAERIFRKELDPYSVSRQLIREEFVQHEEN